MRKKAELNVEVPNSILAQLNGAIPGDGFEYIARCSINENNELIFYTNCGRVLNAGVLPAAKLTENHFQTFVKYINENITEENLFTDEFYNKFVDYINNNPDVLNTQNPVVTVVFHQEDGVVLPSKTIDQIKQAVADGQTVICEYATEGRRFRGTLLYHSEEAFVFSVKDWEGKEVFFQINADGSLNYDERLVPELFVVYFTESDGTYTADKTFAEVKAALDGGNVVVADWTNMKLRGQLTGYSDDLLEFTFHSFLGADAYLILQSDNTVTHLVSEVGKEEIPSLVSVAKNGNVITVTATVSGSLGGFGDEVTTITLNDDGDPVSVTKDGKTTTLTWSGFDE